MDAHDQEEELFFAHPFGIRFAPTDGELVEWYLIKKVNGDQLPCDVVIDQDDIKEYHPAELTEKYKEKGIDEACWYFFTKRETIAEGGSRAKREAKVGFWKTTAKAKPVYDDNFDQIAVDRQLVFYERISKAQSRKTNWIMHEYTLYDPHMPLRKANGATKSENWAICKMYHKGNHGDAGGTEEEVPNSSSSSEWEDLYYPPLLQDHQASSSLAPLQSFQSLNHHHPQLLQEIPNASSSEERDLHPPQLLQETSSSLAPLQSFQSLNHQLQRVEQYQPRAFNSMRINQLQEARHAPDLTAPGLIQTARPHGHYMPLPQQHMPIVMNCSHSVEVAAGDPCGSSSMAQHQASPVPQIIPPRSPGHSLLQNPVAAPNQDDPVAYNGKKRPNPVEDSNESPSQQRIRMSPNCASCSNSQPKLAEELQGPMSNDDNNNNNSCSSSSGSNDSFPCEDVHREEATQNQAITAAPQVDEDFYTMGLCVPDDDLDRILLWFLDSFEDVVGGISP